MPNWTDTSLSAVLPSRCVEKFKSYFLGKEEENACKKEYFARTFLGSCQEEKNQHGMSVLYIEAECAWSVYSCLVEGYPGVKEDGRKAITLQEAIDECGVRRLTLRSQECGIGFEESITYDRDKGKGLDFDTRDLYPDPYAEYLATDEEEKEEKEDAQLG